MDTEDNGKEKKGKDFGVAERSKVKRKLGNAPNKLLHAKFNETLNYAECSLLEEDILYYETSIYCTLLKTWNASSVFFCLCKNPFSLRHESLHFSLSSLTHTMQVSSDGVQLFGGFDS